MMSAPALAMPTPIVPMFGTTGHLDRDAGVGVGGLEFVDQFGEVFDRVEVVVVARADQVGAGGGVTRGGDLLGHLAGRAGVRPRRAWRPGRS